MNKLKRCPSCGVEKKLDDFSKDKSKKDGRKTRCKVCIKGVDRDYRIRAADKRNRLRELQEEQALLEQQLLEEETERCKAEEKRKKQDIYFSPEEVEKRRQKSREYARISYQKNKEKRKAKQKQYYAENKEKIKAKRDAKKVQ